MSKIDKLIKKLMSEEADNDFDFDDLRKVINHFGFNEEIKGSHHTYRIKGKNAFINIQPLKGTNQNLIK